MNGGGEALPHASPHETKSRTQNDNLKTMRCRNSRLLSMVLGFSTFAVIAYGVFELLDHNGIHFRRTSPDFDTLRSMEDVNLHGEPEDCWMILDGTIYDLTNYDHPGGMAYIHGRCGRDGTSGFDSTHSRHYVPLISEFARGKLQIESTDASSSPVATPVAVPLPVPVPVPTPLVSTPTATSPQCTSLAPLWSRRPSYMCFKSFSPCSHRSPNTLLHQ